MAATAITPVEYLAGVLTEVMQAANADGNYINNYTGKQEIQLFNDGVAARTVTFNSIVASNYGTDVNLAVVVAADARMRVKLPVPATRWRDTDGALQITYDAVTDLSVGAYKWPE